MKILVTGLKQSGKSTFANILEKYGFQHFQFSERLKHISGKIIPLIFSDLIVINNTLYNSDLKEVCSIDWEDNEFKKMVIPSKFNKENMTVRGFLQHFGTDFVRRFINNDYWKDTLYYQLDTFPVQTKGFVVSDLRFENEIKEDTIVIGIDRGYKLEGGDHASELEIPRIIENHAKFTIDSNCDIEEYESRCRKLIESEILPLLKEK